MIRLFQIPPSLKGTPNPSPFCVKLECALRLGGIPYEIEHVANPAAGPKHKVPFVEIDGTRIGDSTLIIDTLRAHGLDLDRNLGARERATSHALQRMIEERLYFVLVYSRWMEPDNWPKLKALFFARLPLPLRLIVPRMARKSVRNSIMMQGTGRHTREEIYAFGARDLAAMSEILGDKPFFFGASPSLADASAFGLLASIIGPDIESPLKAAALGHANLVAYCERMGELFANAGRARAMQGKVAA